MYAKITWSRGSEMIGCGKGWVTHGLLHVGDQVVPVLGLLETGKGHLGTRDVLLGVLEVLK